MSDNQEPCEEKTRCYQIDVGEACDEVFDNLDECLVRAKELLSEMDDGESIDIFVAYLEVGKLPDI